MAEADAGSGGMAERTREGELLSSEVPSPQVAARSRQGHHRGHRVDAGGDYQDMLSRKVPYKDLGAEHFEQKSKEKI